MRADTSMRTRRRGFVLFIALAMVALLGVALAALASSISSDSRRTMNRMNDAQLQQMLLAAASMAPDELANHPPTANATWQTALPQVLIDQEATLRTTVVSTSDDGSITLQIRATLPRRVAEQTIILTRTDGRWNIISAELQQ